MLQFNSVQFLVIGKQHQRFLFTLQAIQLQTHEGECPAATLKYQTTVAKKRTVLEKQNPYKKQVQKGSSVWKRKTTPID